MPLLFDHAAASTSLRRQSGRLVGALDIKGLEGWEIRLEGAGRSMSSSE